jgi:hypothetical protein
MEENREATADMLWEAFMVMADNGCHDDMAHSLRAVALDTRMRLVLGLQMLNLLEEVGGVWWRCDADHMSLREQLLLASTYHWECAHEIMSQSWDEVNEELQDVHNKATEAGRPASDSSGD